MLDHSVLPQPEQVSRLDSSRNSHHLPPTALKPEPSSHNTCKKRASNKSPKYWEKIRPFNVLFFFFVYFETLIAVMSSSDTAVPTFWEKRTQSSIYFNCGMGPRFSEPSGKHRYPFSPQSYRNNFWASWPISRCAQTLALKNNLSPACSYLTTKGLTVLFCSPNTFYIWSSQQNTKKIRVASSGQACCA